MKHRLIKTLILSFTALLAVGCGGGGGDQPEFIDYTKSEEVRLKLDYKDHDFYKDGVGQVTLKTPIDGDTAHFYPMVTTTSSMAIKSRFWGVDTPESTGRIEEYGVQASNFTKEKLKEANEHGTIVVSTPRDDYGVPSADSTGERYVSLIWISLDTPNAPFSDLILLNLWIVQEGLSYVKNVSDIPSYQSIFIAAEKQARDFKLKLWSGEKDPYYNYGKYETTSLLDLKREIEKRVEGINVPEEESFKDKKVRIVGTVAGLSDGIMYLQNFYNMEQGANGTAINPYTHEQGEYAGINIFCGMSGVPSRYSTPGTYIEICGIVVVSEIFGFQLTGAEGHFPSIASLEDEDDCHVKIAAADNNEEYQLNTFEYSPAELDAALSSQDLNVKYASFYCSTKLTAEVTCTKFYKSQSNEITLTFGSHKFQAFLTTAYKGNPYKTAQFWDTAEFFEGKSFYVSGVLAAYTGGSKPRYQFVFTMPNEELHCTDYYNADGSLKGAAA